jgi:hypothetical protein
MAPPETSTASGHQAGHPTASGPPAGAAASQAASQPAKKGVAARGMSIAPLALAVLAQVGAIGHGGATAPAPTGTQAVKCGPGITDYQACHDRYATGCSAGGAYDGYLNSLKNELVDPASLPQHTFDVPGLVALEKGLPADLTKVNHQELEGQMSALGEGEVSSLNGYLYYAKDGGSESSNCLLKGADNIDFHIGIGADPAIAAKAKTPGLSPADRRQAVIVEMTPHWRAEYEPGWNLALVQKALGRKVYLVGQLLADNEHDDSKDDCAFTGTPGAGSSCWRATIWELHPVTRFLVCSAAACADNGVGPGWVPLDSFDPGKAG